MGQPELAKAAGIKQPTLSNIETGRNKGSAYAAQLAAALKCSAYWLATGRGTKEPEAGAEQHAADYGVLSAREEMLVHLFRGLFSLQQRRLIVNLQAAFDANQITRRELGQKPLNGVSDAQIEAAFGAAPFPAKLKKRATAKREPGTAMDDFLGEPE